MDKQDDIISDTIEVTGLDDIQAIELYFEGRTSGGGKDKEVECIKKIDDGIVHVKFASIEGKLYIHVYLAHF